MHAAQQTQTLAVALIQTDLFWEDATANLASLEEKIAGLSEPADIIVLPEMFNSGFTMNTAAAEPMNYTTTRWMKQMAVKNKALIVGSIAVKEEGKYYNRLMCVDPDGSYTFNDKKHLFSFGQEDLTYTPGKSRLIIDYKGWKICPLVCYDLRFPVWSRNIASDPYDLLIYVANWPARRAHAWNTLLRARAIENQSYVVGVNRIGSDPNGLTYQGDSVALDYLGEPLSMLTNAETEKIITFSKADLHEYRIVFPALADADEFQIKW
ncbi:amidohydrolase [Dyadobacter sp. LJ419]|uniref:Omega-amidase YafV n=1 Tax=Dyadobacter chenwenxiniae TaxID=2906456 RepID=A0A9X1TL93_9BACT|nr:amidohydrolase [Dyadobacter chenwenxiniae]MCF0061978.1 amidohydrolase [Dyadobacter chenwenxiniae]